MGRLCRLFCAVAYCAACASAQDPISLVKSFPAYQFKQQVTGTIRIWGKKQMREIVKHWEDGFTAHHPDVHFETHLRGQASAIGGLYSGVADIALTERDPWPVDIDAFEETFQHKPFGIEVFNGGLEARDPESPLAIFVHKDNPLSHVTLAQVDAIFGGDLRRGSKVVRTWGDLGLKGKWAARPIHTYGYSPANREFAHFFEDAAMAGSRKWKCDMQEFSDRRQADGSLVEAGQQIVDAVAKDPNGIAYSSLLYKNLRTKALALAPAMTSDRYGIAYSIEIYKQPVVKLPAPRVGGPYFAPTERNIIQWNYPLTRTVSIFINRAPGMPVNSRIREFLLYILSRDGQSVVIRYGRYLPLSRNILLEERRKLE
jgi:phosphate transport system substrate-binding protein